MAQVNDPPAILPRGAWGALPPRRTARLGAVELAVVHHTTGPSRRQDGRTPELIREIQRLHMESNGWDDIGYNLLIDERGRVYEGRAGGPDQAVIGAHALGLNARSTGIALVGDFSVAAPSEPACEALAALLGWKLGRHGLSPGDATVIAHRDLAATACPGAGIVERLPELRARAAAATTVAGS